jgi:hypothetical protein
LRLAARTATSSSPVTQKDLRDTFASQQPGHADVSVTARHYARWCGGDEYREPLTLGDGDIPHLEERLVRRSRRSI